MYSISVYNWLIDGTTGEKSCNLVEDQNKVPSFGLFYI